MHQLDVLFTMMSCQSHCQLNIFLLYLIFSISGIIFHPPLIPVIARKEFKVLEKSPPKQALSPQKVQIHIPFIDQASQNRLYVLPPEFSGILCAQAKQHTQTLKRWGPYNGGNLPKVRSRYCPHEILHRPPKVDIVYQRAYDSGLLEFSHVKSPQASLQIWTPPYTNYIT